MEKLFILLILINLLFLYNVDGLKKIINSNSPKIDKIMHLKDTVYLFEVAILLNRFDLVKKAKKEKVNFQIRDEEVYLAVFLEILNSKLKDTELYKDLECFEK